MTVFTGWVPFESGVWMTPEELAHLADVGADAAERVHGVKLMRPAKRIKFSPVVADRLCAVFEFESADV